MILRASLPMYDLPEVRMWTDRLWAAIAEELREGRRRRRSGRARASVRSSRCMAAGTDCCSRSRAAIRRRRRSATCCGVVATPHYAASGCEGPRYSSVVVAREASRVVALEELRGAVCAFNSRDSQSGYNALRAADRSDSREDGRFFARTVETGAHAASMEAVRCGRADVCAVDCVTWALHARHSPSALVGLEVIRYTGPAPGLPFVTAGDVSDATFASIREALGRAFVRPDLAETRDALLISGLSILPADAYEPLLAMERAAAASGYPGLE